MNMLRLKLPIFVTAIISGTVHLTRMPHFFFSVLSGDNELMTLCNDDLYIKGDTLLLQKHIRDGTGTMPKPTLNNLSSKLKVIIVCTAANDIRQTLHRSFYKFTFYSVLCEDTRLRTCCHHGGRRQRRAKKAN